MKTKPPFYLTIQLVRLALGYALILVLCSVLGQRVQAQSAPDSAPTQMGTGIFSPDELEELLGPIALYPDALIALILPASTAPAEVTLASRFLAGGGTAEQIEGQAWEESVKSLARYPDVISWMDENLEWTASLGDAFATQPTEVMNALQRLRGQARAAGNLKDSSEQTVVEEIVEDDTFIRIVPADPEYIYVPVYNPRMVFSDRSYGYYGSLVSFGAGFAIGSWLNYDCDWGRRGVYYGNYRPGWNRPWYHGRSHHGKRVRNTAVGNTANVNVININPGSARNWSPGSGSLRRRNVRRGRERDASVARVDRPVIQTANGSEGGNSARFRAPGTSSARAKRQGSGSNLRERSGQYSPNGTLGQNNRLETLDPTLRSSAASDRNIRLQKRFSKRPGKAPQSGASAASKSDARTRLANQGNRQNTGTQSSGATLTVPAQSPAARAQSSQLRSQQLSGSSKKSQGSTLRSRSRSSQGSAVQTRTSRQSVNRSATSGSGRARFQTGRQSRAAGVQGNGSSASRSSSAAGQSSRSRGSWGGGNAVRGQQGR